MLTRRNVILSGAALAGSAALNAKTNVALAAPNDDAIEQAQSAHPGSASVDPKSGPYGPGEPGKDYTPVVTPNGSTLPFKVVDGVKVFHLVAEHVQARVRAGAGRRLLGLQRPDAGADDRGGRGRPRAHLRHQPPARADDRPLARHPAAQRHGRRRRADPAADRPGETFRYEFTLRQHGTFMYHPHFDEMTQMAMGMMGMFVIHPRDPRAAPRPDRDFAIMLSEWAIEPGHEHARTRTR